MSEHTPGPWHFEHGWIREAATRPIACIDPIRPEYEANARLIAAAPELLDALRALDMLLDFAEPASDDMPMVFDGYGPLNAAFEKARAAIAKSEGR